MTKGGQLDATHIRFREDIGTESGAAWLAGEDESVSLTGNGTKFRIRITIEETTGIGTGVVVGSLKLEYSFNNGPVETVTHTGDIVREQGSHADLTDGEATTAQMPTTPGTFEAGEVDLDNDIGKSAVQAGGYTELEWALELGSDVVEGTTIDFEVAGIISSIPARIDNTEVSPNYFPLLTLGGNS